MRLVVALGGSLLWDKAGISGDRGVQEEKRRERPQYSPLLISQPLGQQAGLEAATEETRGL